MRGCFTLQGQPSQQNWWRGPLAIRTSSPFLARLALPTGALAEGRASPETNRHDWIGIFSPGEAASDHANRWYLVTAERIGAGIHWHQDYVPQEAALYEVRYYSHRDELLATAPLAVQGDLECLRLASGAHGGLFPLPIRARFGHDFVLRFVMPDGCTAKDWIGFYKQGALDSDWLESCWNWCSPDGERPHVLSPGVILWSAERIPKEEGIYELRYLRSPCLDALGVSRPFRLMEQQQCPMCLDQSDKDSESSLANTVILDCGHWLHKECAERMLVSGLEHPSRRLSFGHTRCPLCQSAPLDHPSLEHLWAPTQHLQRQAEIVVKCRAAFEGASPEEAVKLFLDGSPRGYAIYRCSVCRYLFYNGLIGCALGGPDEDLPPAVCHACRPPPDICPCGSWVYKCDYCCSLATFECGNGRHYCDACHESGEELWKMRLAGSLHEHREAGPGGSQLGEDQCPLLLNGWTSHCPSGETCGRCLLLCPHHESGQGLRRVATCG